MGIVSKAYTFANGDIIDALKFNKDFDDLYGEFNGNIDNTNIKGGAGIVGTKIADAPNGIPTVKINDNAVTSAKLLSNVSDNTQRAVTSDHIKDGAAIRRTVPTNGISLDKLGTAPVLQKTHVPTFLTPGGGGNIMSVVSFINGANYEFTVTLANNSASPDIILASNFAPVTPIPTASKELLSVYLANLVFTVNNVAFDIVSVALDKT
jgi:hypothetical protein